jgi:putative component of membrane protein insertase Oxa1/YidC/SpoIIIJ protein YidD
MHNDNKTERFISIPSLMVRNCTVTPTAMGAALQFIRRAGAYTGIGGLILFRIALCQWTL